MRFSELKEKEVINVRGGQRIGYVADVEFNPLSGDICQLIIPGHTKFCGFFGHETEYIIGWRCICQIGPDLILVNVDMEEIIKKCST